MTTYYTEAAEERLDEIAGYTAAAHGVEQRDRYMRMLRQVCEVLLPAQWSQISRPEPAFEGLHRYRAEHHVIYFRALSRRDLEVVDVLHERQLPVRHLRDAPSRSK